MKLPQDYLLYRDGDKWCVLYRSNYTPVLTNEDGVSIKHFDTRQAALDAALELIAWLKAVLAKLD